MLGWLEDNWKTIVVIAVATVVFAAVTLLTGGLGAPLMLSLAAGGFSSGVAAYVTQQLLDDQPIDPVEAVKQGAISMVVTVATAGILRAAAPAVSRVLSPAANRVVPAVVPNVVRTVAVDAATGAATGGATQVATNAINDRPLTENLDRAIITGAATGPLVRPLAARTTPIVEEAPSQARTTKGIAPALDDLETFSAGNTKPGKAPAPPGGGSRGAPAVEPPAAVLDPVTRATMEKYGIDENTVVYRTMDPRYLDTANKRVSGNPKSVALVNDPYNPVENPLVKLFDDQGVPLPDRIPRQVPRRVSASKLDKPGLNVALEDPKAYGQNGNVKIAIRVGDILKAGGKIYPDVGSNVPLIKPLIVTFDGSVPYEYAPS